MYLGGVGTLGEDVVSTFTGAISSAATKTVRGIIVGRLGLEDKARSTAIFGELVKLLPADLFRPCLAQVWFSVRLRRCIATPQWLGRAMEDRRMA